MEELEDKAVTNIKAGEQEITEGFGLSSKVILEALGRPAVLVLKQEEPDRNLALHTQSLPSIGCRVEFGV